MDLEFVNREDPSSQHHGHSGFRSPRKLGSREIEGREPRRDHL